MPLFLKLGEVFRDFTSNSDFTLEAEKPSFNILLADAFQSGNSLYKFQMVFGTEIY